MSLRIGVDVGGTNTDAVLMDGRDLISAVKRPTSSDVTGGIVAALAGLVAEARVPSSAIRRVMIGTTHFTNAVVQRRDLLPTAVVRLAPQRQRCCHHLSIGHWTSHGRLRREG